MVAKQLSVFLENKSGRLAEVTELLGEAGINLSAMSIADSSDFGILRCVVSNPDEACRVLKAAGFAVKVTDVIVFECPNEKGALSRILRQLGDRQVFIEYLYSFNSGETAHVVIRPTDFDVCNQVLNAAGVDILPADAVYRI